MAFRVSHFGGSSQIRGKLRGFVSKKQQREKKKHTTEIHCYDYSALKSLWLTLFFNVGEKLQFSRVVFHDTRWEQKQQ